MNWLLIYAICFVVALIIDGLLFRFAILRLVIQLLLIPTRLLLPHLAPLFLALLIGAFAIALVASISAIRWGYMF